MSLEAPKILLFGKWDSEEVEVKDPGLRQYINLRPIYIPHTEGRHQHHRFHKAHVHIVERFINKLMQPGRNAGKKLRAMRFVEQAFDLIHLKTGRNPIQVLVDAIENSAPREETTRISYGGIMSHTAVDSAPQRRVDVALRLLAEACRRQSFNNVIQFPEVIADQLILAANGDNRSYAVNKKHEIERIALSAR